MNIILIFIEGLSRLINPPTYYRKRFSENSAPSVRDFESLKSDWQAIGRDFLKVMNGYVQDSQNDFGRY